MPDAPHAPDLSPEPPVTASVANLTGPAPGSWAHRLGARRAAAVALTLLLPVPTIGVLVPIVWLPGPVGQTIYFAAKAWLILLPAVWYLGVERRRPSFSPMRRGGLAVGAAVGLVISVLIGLGYMLVGTVVIDPETIRPIVARNRLDEPARYLALAAYLTVVNALVEEYVWRWFAFRQFETVLGTGGEAEARGGGAGRVAWTAAVLAAAAFTAHHVVALGAQFGPVVTVLGSTGVFVGGLTWSVLYLRYRSIWPAYVSHAIVDIAVFIVGWRIIFAGG